MLFVFLFVDAKILLFFRSTKYSINKKTYFLRSLFTFFICNIYISKLLQCKYEEKDFSCTFFD